MKFIGVGQTCQTAFQIRRHTGDPTTYFFDWLISGISCVENIMCDFDEKKFLMLDNMDIVDNNIRVRDNYSGVKFQHDFPVYAGGRSINPAKIPVELERVREKFLFLRRRTLEALQTAEANSICLTYFALSQPFEVCKKISSILQKINDIYPSTFNLITSNSIDNTFSHGKSIVTNIRTYKGHNVKFNWRGDDSSWDHAFEIAKKYA